MRKIAELTIGIALLASAGTWSGALVDADCYAAQERNINARDTLMNVDRDRDYEIRYCRPGPKTKSFAIVDHDGQSTALDSGANARAAEIVAKTPRKEGILVTVTGEKDHNTIKVESIAARRGS